MIIGIDGNEANVANQVGVSVYTFQLLRYFHQKASKDQQFVIYLKQKPLPHMPTETDFFRYQVVFGPVLWSRIFFPLALLFQRNLSVLFAPAHYSPPLLPVPLVVTIHDLAYHHFPKEFLPKDRYKLEHWTAESVSKAHSIIAVSKATKKDLLTLFPDQQSKIRVIYNGYQQTDQTETAILSNLKLERRQYLLFVGTLQPRKNIETLIEAAALLKQTGKPIPVVIVGKKGWMYESLFQRVRDMQLEDLIYFTGYLPDDDVHTLYRHATLLVNPSRYEGFGIPVLEAMARGCPVLAAQTGSLPEIGGDAAWYFDPNNAQQLSQKIHDLLRYPSSRSKLTKAGYERVSLFSWETAAEETLSVLATAAS